LNMTAGPHSPPTLEKYGFRPAGSWRPHKVASGIGYQLDAFVNDRVVYAFVVEDRVMYIGICDKDTTTLKSRMSRYQTRQGSGTNERVAGQIRRCLTAGKAVRIYALRPDGEECRYKGLNVDLVRGLENPVIRALQPPWNSSRRSPRRFARSRPAPL